MDFQDIKYFFKETKLGAHIYSFAKTYITVFLSIYLTLNGVIDDIDITKIVDVNVTDMYILSVSAKGALLSVVRNIYKIMTE